MAKSEPAQIWPEEKLAEMAGGTETLTDAISEALTALSMTRCPYFVDGLPCDRGCHTEPSCHTDEPIEGWVGAAIKALEGALPEDQEGSPDA